MGNLMPQQHRGKDSPAHPDPPRDPSRCPQCSQPAGPRGTARIAAALRAALSRAIIEAYALRHKFYTERARGMGRPWNHALTLLTFLSGSATRRSDAWRQQLIAALRYARREAGTADFAQDPAIALAMRGLRRQRPQKPAQESGLTFEVSAKIEATACSPRKGDGRGHCMEAAKAAIRRGHVDIALVRTMRDGLMRRSEAAAFKWQDLSTESYGSGRLHIARSKIDQEAADTWPTFEGIPNAPTRTAERLRSRSWPLSRVRPCSIVSRPRPQVGLQHALRLW